MLLILPSASATPTSIETTLLVTDRTSWSEAASKVTHPRGEPRTSSAPAQYHSATVSPPRRTSTLCTLGSSPETIRCLRASSAAASNPGGPSAAWAEASEQNRVTVARSRRLCKLDLTRHRGESSGDVLR